MNLTVYVLHLGNVSAYFVYVCLCKLVYSAVVLMLYVFCEACVAMAASPSKCSINTGGNMTFYSVFTWGILHNDYELPLETLFCAV